VDFMARIIASLSSSFKKMVAFQLHPIAHITIVGCNTKKQQSSPRLFYAQMCQFIALYAPLLSLAIWKYNALYHLISEHSSGSTPPSIPGQLLVQMFITKEEEKALGILEHDTDDWRRQNNIPDSDGV
jgi:hypothetical protein